MKKTHSCAQNDIDRAKQVITLLTKEYPNYHTLLTFANAYELLIAVILSAQTTDAQVNRATPDLFTQYPTPHALMNAKQVDVERIIHSTGFYKNKTKNIMGAAKGLVERFGGQVPNNIDDLTILPGVGRKTAGVVLYHIFDLPAIIVDTHFGRMCRRLGFTIHDNPAKVEQDIMTLLPDTLWGTASMVVNFHGRYVCKSRKPECYRCVLAIVCPNKEHAEHIK